jgi:predicted Zn-dependent protease
MGSGIAKWIPGIVAAAAIVGFITWLMADSPVAGNPSIAVVAQPKPDLASFDPPECPPGPPVMAATVDEPLFAEAMKYYRERDYSRASFALQKATSSQPENPEIRFYLGVAYLLTDDTQAGIRELKVAERLGQSPYMDRIQFYLAKAFLKQKDTASAIQELNTVAASGGNLAESAKKLRSELTNPNTE